MREQLTKLRALMAARHIDAYLIPTTDFHGSEYVNDYFKCRRYVSGFTGSAGTLLVTPDEAWLWTDGRYFLQAADQLAGTGIGLMKEKEPGVPTIAEYLASLAGRSDAAFRLGFDGRVVDCTAGERFAELCSDIEYELDLVGEIWEDRPQIQPSEIYALPESVTGESAASKLFRLREYLKDNGAQCHLMTSLEEIAWLFNLRGSDVANTPVFFAFALITGQEARLYVMDRHLPPVDGVTVLPYLQIFEDIKTLDAETILLDQEVVSYALIKSLPKKTRIISGRNPVSLMKALKNPAEIAATRRAHVKDGAAMVRFLCWLKQSVSAVDLTEVSAADYLERCRRAQEGCFDLSFPTIAGYGPNGAIVHYDPMLSGGSPLKAEGLLLVDSGGQYTDGTTDITRTIALGPLTEEMKRHYTLVLRSHIALARAVFPAGTTGAELDRIARKPLRDQGLDFNHGTGHGVGHILSVHEGPQRIAETGTACPFYPGMITSNEPGVYIEGSHGIRLENEILCVEKENGSYGFETITLCPFDREAILPELMTDEELSWLNRYHEQVREILLPLVDEETGRWLTEATAEIRR